LRGLGVWLGDNGITGIPHVVSLAVSDAFLAANSPKRFEGHFRVQKRMQVFM
jgi:hypothetical protein